MERINPERREFLRLLGLGGGAVLLGGVRIASGAAKEVFPADRITWVCYVKAGGGWDLIARSVSPYLSKYLKEVSKSKGGDVTVKNVPEAGGARAYSNIYNAKPDGYTIGDFNAAYVTETIISPDKPEIDFNKYTYVTRTGVSLRMIISNKNGFKTWDEMMKAAKEKELKFGASNFGRGHHISCILVKETAKLNARLINFPGVVENTNALLRGDVQISVASEESVIPMINAGEIRVLTVLAEKSTYPGVPSIAELGYPELAEPLKLHRFVIAPPKLPKEILDTYVAAFKRVMSDKDFLAQAKKLEFDVDPIYGPDAERVARQFFKYYEEKTPILKKYLT